MSVLYLILGVLIVITIAIIFFERSSRTTRRLERELKAMKHNRKMRNHND